MATDASKKIRLGICMAGAVSAGAYTAGVVDYLIETLERWERQKDKIRKSQNAGEPLRAGEELIPLYDVVIEVLSGASAGGMTAAILSYSFNDDTFITKRKDEPVATNYNRPADTDDPTKLYDCWINMIDDEKSNTFSKLMETGDVVSLNKMPSLLNSKPIDQIAAKAVPAKINFKPPGYISKDLSIVLSVTNVEGVPIDIRFSNIPDTEATRNVLWMHSGYLHYQYNQSDYSLDFPPEIISEQFKDHLASAAKATGAFPFGLSNRRIFVTPQLFEEFKLRMKTNYKMDVNTILPVGKNYVFTAVDGGAINNEPVGTTEKILCSKQEKHHPNDEHYVILIDPFPTVTNDQLGESYVEPGSYTMTQQAVKLLGAFRNQSSFKQEDLLKGLEMKENKFLVYPSKRKRYYLACGEVFGFSGFLKKSFRQHDYQLGRKNCQSFLRYYFGVSIEKLESITRSKLSEEQKRQWRYDLNFGKAGKNPEWRFPLIPDMLMLDSKEVEIDGPEYDGLTVDEMNVITSSIRERISKITDATYPSLVDTTKKASSLVGRIVNIWPIKGFLKKKIGTALADKVDKYLHDTFSPQLIKQEALVTKVRDIIESKGSIYQKKAGVWAEVAEGGENIVSTTQDGKETVNTASTGDYIVENETRAREKYILKPGVFKERYTHSHDNYYKPSDKARVYALQLTGETIYSCRLTVFNQLISQQGTTTFIEAPWKESQKVQLNDYLVSLASTNEVYRIANAEFNETYKRV